MTASGETGILSAPPSFSRLMRRLRHGVLLPVYGGNLALNAGGSHTGRGHKHEQSGIRPARAELKAIGRGLGAAVFAR